MYDAAPVYRLLARVRFRLNLILLTTKSLTFLTWVAATSGIILLIARWTGWVIITIQTWLTFVLIGGLTGLVTGWRQRLDEIATARWMDEKLKSEEVLSAALVCLGRECSGLFDQEILEVADGLSRKTPAFKWPVRKLFNRLGIAASVILLFSTALIFVTPYHYQNYQTAPLKNSKTPESTGGRSGRSGNRLVIESPRTLARMLFPEDARLAVLAERALREGDLSVFENLIKDAQLNLEQKLAETTNPGERNRLKKEAERRQQITQSLIAEARRQYEAATEEGEDTVASGTGEEAGRNRKGNGKRPAGNNKYGKDQGLQYGDQETEDGPDYSPDGAYKGGSLAGTGHNEERGRWGEVKARSGKEAPIISKNKDSAVFEYILPGKNASLPLSQVIPDSQRAAEAALKRDGVPYEYEDFVRYYFLLLSKETKGAAIKEAQK